MEFVAEEPSRQRAYDLPKKYTPSCSPERKSHLDAAAKQLAGADEKYHRRLHFIRCGLDYTKLVVDTRAWMQKFEASKGKDAEAKARVLANWQRVETMKTNFPRSPSTGSLYSAIPCRAAKPNASWACTPTRRSAAERCANSERLGWSEVKVCETHTALAFWVCRVCNLIYSRLRRCS